MTERLPAHATILVVDDEQANRDLFARLLGRHGYYVVAVNDGEAALKAVEPTRPDLILLDVQMPGINGFEVCRILKQRPETRLTPVVLVTGLNARQHRIKGSSVGADDFLSKPVDPEELTTRVGSLVRLKRYTDELESAESLVTSLALTIEARDPYTEGHCQHVAAYATALGVRLQLPDDEIACLQRGGYLHDIGKVGISDSILQKAGKLTASEYQAIKQHAVIGARICQSLRSLEAVRPIVRSHHERCDGSGYPDGLRGDEIPRLAEFVAIADVYDAMTNTRPYRAALPPEYVCEELVREAARGLHREDLVRPFVELARSGALEPIAEAARAKSIRSPRSFI